MSNEAQRIPLEDAKRTSIEVTDGHLVVSWDPSVREIVIDGAELEVERAADELFLRGELTSKRRRSSGIEVSTDAKKYKLAFGGGHIEHDRETNETSLRWDFLRGLGGKDRGSSETIWITLPAEVEVSQIEVKRGDLRLNDSVGTVDAEVKAGDFYANGGAADLTVSAGSGNSLIEQHQGAIVSMSGSGDVRISNTQGLLEIKAGSGNITVLDVSAPHVDIMAGAGSVELQQVSAGDLKCKTGSGDVEIAGGVVKALDIRCGSGDVEASTVFGPFSQSIATGSGDIALGIPRDLPLRIEAYTLGGDISSDIQLVSVGQRGPRSERTRRQVGSVGSGEPRADVNLRTSSGDIRLYWLSSHAEPAPSVPATRQDVIPAPAPTQPHQPDSSSDAHKEILEALARGEISVDEAEALLAKLD